MCTLIHSYFFSSYRSFGAVGPHCTVYTISTWQRWRCSLSYCAACTPAKVSRPPHIFYQTLTQGHTPPIMSRLEGLSLSHPCRTSRPCQHVQCSSAHTSKVCHSFCPMPSSNICAIGFLQMPWTCQNRLSLLHPLRILPHRWPRVLRSSWPILVRTVPSLDLSTNPSAGLPTKIATSALS
jgi:hypothetical protein